MIDWLRREQMDPHIELSGRRLPLVIKRNPRAKRMTMRLAPNGSEVRLTMPRWGRTVEALKFAESRREWLELQLAKQPVYAPPIPGGIVQYRGDGLHIMWDEKAPRRPQVLDESITIGGPETSLQRRLQRWLEDKAIQLMEDDLAFYCAAAGRKPPPLRLSRAQRRWGSCSSDGTIRINWRLIQAPDDVRRSVVAHEVAHLIHFDHSPDFHKLLGELFEGDIKLANHWLKSDGRSLYAAFG